MVEAGTGRTNEVLDRGPFGTKRIIPRAGDLPASLPENGLPLDAKPRDDRPGKAPAARPERMGEHLATHGLGHEPAAGRKHALDLAKGLVGCPNVMARTEVDDEVEGPIGKGEGADVAAGELDGAGQSFTSFAGDRQKRWIDVQAHQSVGPEETVENREGDPTARADLEDPPAHRERQEADKEGDLDDALEEVPAGDIGEGRVVGSARIGKRRGHGRSPEGDQRCRAPRHR